MKCIAQIIIILLFHNMIFGQDTYINVKNLPTPDCSGKTLIWNDFEKNETRLLVIPDIPSDSSEYLRIFNYMKNGYADSLIKKESELTDSDFKKGLVLYGQIRDYKNWNQFNLPFTKTINGFKFLNKEYSNKGDGFFYISKDRMVYSGNSLEPIWKQQSTYATYYRSMIFRNGLLDQLWITDGLFINVAEIRKTNYVKNVTNYYNLFIDKKLQNVTVSDSIVIKICVEMELELPDFKINAFLHNDPNATRLFSNFYFMAGCDTLEPTMNFGTVQIDGIHTTGKDIGFVKHETFHYLWGKLVGLNPNSNEFLNEGVQKYYEFLTDSSVLNYAVKIQNKHLDFDLTNLVKKGDMNSFWNAPSENNYPISYELSGLFVKYLIDNWGLDKFKALFTHKDINLAFTDLYNLEVYEIIDRYKGWVNTLN